LEGKLPQVAVIPRFSVPFWKRIDGGNWVSAVEESTNLESSLREHRVFAPSAEFVAKAHVQGLEQYEALYRRSVEDPEGFWGEAAEELEWFAPWSKVLVGEGSRAQWFVDGKLNLSHNCVDRHALGARKDKVALLWEGEPGEVRRLTYGELHSQVQAFANVLKQTLGVRKGDRACVRSWRSRCLPARALARCTR
jgi:acetyl-CoA synthetase